MQTISIDGEHLTIEEIVAVARHGAKVTLSNVAREAIDKSHTWVEDIIASGAPVYGINTGFGVFAEKRIPPEESAKLSRNLILSHAVATGPAFDDDRLAVSIDCVKVAFSGVNTGRDKIAQVHPNQTDHF